MKRLWERLDKTTFFGFIFVLLAVFLTIVIERTALTSYLNKAAFVLIFFGVLGATTMSFGLKEMLTIPKLLAFVVVEQEIDPGKTIEILASCAEKARREGLLKLEDDLNTIKDPFLRDAIQLVVDGTDRELLDKMLHTKVDYMRERHKMGENIFMTMGGYAPTLGIVGTVMGLIQVLAGGLTDIAKVGGGIAQAFLATFYGIASANLLFLPFAGKLKVKSDEELLVKEMIIEGILSIQSGDNPRLLREKLLAYIPPKKESQKKVKPKLIPTKVKKPAPVKEGKIAAAK